MRIPELGCSKLGDAGVPVTTKIWLSEHGAQAVQAEKPCARRQRGLNVDKPEAVENVSGAVLWEDGDT